MLLNPTYKAVSLYSYNEEPLSVFPTSNCYPLQDMTKIAEFSVLQHLISGMSIIYSFYINMYIELYDLFLKHFYNYRNSVIKHK